MNATSYNSYAEVFHQFLVLDVGDLPKAKREGMIDISALVNINGGRCINARISGYMKYDRPPAKAMMWAACLLGIGSDCLELVLDWRSAAVRGGHPDDETYMVRHHLETPMHLRAFGKVLLSGPSGFTIQGQTYGGTRTDRDTVNFPFEVEFKGKAEEGDHPPVGCFAGGWGPILDVKFGKGGAIVVRLLSIQRPAPNAGVVANGTNRHQALADAYASGFQQGGKNAGNAPPPPSPGADGRKTGGTGEEFTILEWATEWPLEEMPEEGSIFSAHAEMGMLQGYAVLKLTPSTISFRPGNPNDDDYRELQGANWRPMIRVSGILTEVKLKQFSLLGRSKWGGGEVMYRVSAAIPDSNKQFQHLSSLSKNQVISIRGFLGEIVLGEDGMFEVELVSLQSAAPTYTTTHSATGSSSAKVPTTPKRSAASSKALFASLASDSARKGGQTGTTPEPSRSLPSQDAIVSPSMFDAKTPTPSARPSPTTAGTAAAFKALLRAEPISDSVSERSAATDDADSSGEEPVIVSVKRTEVEEVDSSGQMMETPKTAVGAARAGPVITEAAGSESSSLSPATLAVRQPTLFAPEMRTGFPWTSTHPSASMQSSAENTTSAGYVQAHTTTMPPYAQNSGGTMPTNSFPFPPYPPHPTYGYHHHHEHRQTDVQQAPLVGAEYPNAFPVQPLSYAYSHLPPNLSFPSRVLPASADIMPNLPRSEPAFGRGMIPMASIAPTALANSDNPSELDNRGVDHPSRRCAHSVAPCLERYHICELNGAHDQPAGNGQSEQISIGTPEGHRQRASARQNTSGHGCRWKESTLDSFDRFQQRC
ncbi:hypothetical protein V8E36_005143 [Tilletia maclaganii]